MAQVDTLLTQIARAKRFSNAVSDIADRSKFESIAAKLQLDSLQPALLHRRIMNCTPDRFVDFTSEFLLIDLAKLDGHCRRLLCVH
jgi:hypothetical protein